MKVWQRLLKWAGLTLAAGIALTGCKSVNAPIAFYALAPIGPADHIYQKASNQIDVTIGIGPIDFPKMIDRPQIVTRTTPNAIKVSEFNRWAGSLQDDFLRVLTENISLLLKPGKIFLYPWDLKAAPLLRIDIDVIRFDGTLGDSVALDVIWKISSGSGDRLFLIRKSAIREPASNDGYADLVVSQSRALAAFSLEIVEAVKALAPIQN